MTNSDSEPRVANVTMANAERSINDLTQVMMD